MILIYNWQRGRRSSSAAEQGLDISMRADAR